MGLPLLTEPESKKEHSPLFCQGYLENNKVFSDLWKFHFEIFYYEILDIWKNCLFVF